GASWTVVTSANSSPVENNNLASVTCASTANCWAVGYSSSQVNGTLTVIEHFDGTSWSIVNSPNPSPAKYNVPLGVTCQSATDCWAVGYYFNVNGVYQNIIEHYTVPSVQLNAVVSRKVHGSVGTFDVNLPLTGPPAIECRAPGQTGTTGVDYKLIFVFPDTLASVGSVSATATSPNGPQPVPSS